MATGHGPLRCPARTTVICRCSRSSTILVSDGFRRASSWAATGAIKPAEATIPATTAAAEIRFKTHETRLSQAMQARVENQHKSCFSGVFEIFSSLADKTTETGPPVDPLTLMP